MTPKETVRAFIERLWNARDLATFDEFVSRDVRYQPPRGPEKDYDGYRAMVEAFKGAFPDLHFVIDEAIEEGDLVATRLTITGTHTGGEHLGLAATGKEVNVQGRPWFRVRDGKVVGVWSLYDERLMREQLTG